MGSKAVIITAPLVVFLYDRVFISKSFVQMLRRRWGLYVGLAATWGMLVANGVARGVLNPSPARAATVGFGVQDITPLEYLLTQPGVILHYLRLSFWPNSLCLDYGWPIAKTVAEVVVPGVVVVALLAVTVLALWRKPWLGFLGAWFFIILSPTSSFIPLKDPLFEHRMYLSLAAVIVAVVAGVDASLRYLCARSITGSPLRRVAGVVLAAVAVIALGAVTRHRNEDYRSEIGMWRDVIAKRPDNARAYNNLGTVLDHRGQYKEAIEALREAIRIDPQYEVAYTNLGKTLGRSGRFDEALEALHQALEIAPRYAWAHCAVGAVHAVQGETDEAIKWFRQAIEVKPRFARAHYNLGTALSEKGLADEAVKHLEEAVRLKPRYPDALVNLGAELWKQGQHHEAVEKFREALRINPAHVLGRWHLGYDLLQLERTAEAVQVFRQGIRIHPRDADAHFHLGQALTVANELEEALKEHERALRLQPNHAKAQQARDALLTPRGG
jgi:tetratricopeptide (TPR) repeat protein